MILFAAIKNFVKVAVRTLMDMFLNSFMEWLQNIPILLSSRIQGTLIGAKTFVGKNSNDSGYEVSKNYSLVGDKWQVTSATRNVAMSEIPADIFERSTQNGEIDVTNDLEMVLQ